MHSVRRIPEHAIPPENFSEFESLLPNALTFFPRAAARRVPRFYTSCRPDDGDELLLRKVHTVFALPGSPLPLELPLR